ncbi:hypothetical protein GLYMA_19G056600v4 [Glycine max]|uniref:DUF659 domain-containing protein n=1 Tax=Glycine max TaxID=3847 RepID=A0A0R0EJ63_SOYBN|nr:hypothetical protein GYH30_052167 [Glycine max]KRG94032.1 hypothetical protein GLYMA_19G056600v4 [Glycine max]
MTSKVISKNASGNRTNIGWKHGTDVLGNGKKVKCKYYSKIKKRGIFRFKHHLAGTRWDSEPCPSVPEEVKVLMMKVVAEVANASKKKRKLNSFHEEGRGKAKFVQASGEGVQATLNQLYKKGEKDKVDDQCAEFWYTSVISFNVIKNPAFANFCDMVARYGLGYKPPSYHDIIEKLLKRAVEKTNLMLQEFREEWKRTGCTIMSDGWTNKKRHSICKFFMNSPKEIVFLYSLDTLDISKTTDKVLKMLDDVVNFVREENVVQVVTDNATNYKATGEFSEEWKTSKFRTSQEGRKVQNMALDSRFWKKVTMCLKVATHLMVVLRLLDSGVKPAMSFIYEKMENAKDKLKYNFNNIKKSYEPIWKIIDERWDHQLHRPLHAAAYYLKPHSHYEPCFRHNDP